MKGIISRGVIMIGNDWDEHLKKEYGKAYFQELLKFVDGISRVIYPAIADLRHPWRWDIGKNNKILCRK